MVMNFKNHLLSMDKKLVDMKYINDTYIDGVENLFLTVETENVTYSPCIYLDEDENWVKLLVLSSKNSTQCCAVKKSSIISFGFINAGCKICLTEEETNTCTCDDIYQ